MRRVSGRYIEDEDDYYYEEGEDYAYYADEAGYDYVEVDDDGNEYTESETYAASGSGCALALIALAGGAAVLSALGQVGWWI